MSKLDNINDILYNIIEKLRPMRDKLEYSYATKMIHTINPDFPIYDSYVSSALNLGPIDGNKDDERLKSFLKKINKIIHIYKEIIKDNLLEDAINKFKKKRDISRLSQVKILDLLLWSYGKILRK